MGQEILCTAEFEGKTSEGRAYLETDHMLFRGDFRVSIPLASLHTIRSHDGQLHLAGPDLNITLALGAYSDKWAAKIRNPKTLLDKLGVKTGSCVAVLGVNDEAFLAQLLARVPDALIEITRPGLDLLFYAADSPEQLARLHELKQLLQATGAIWVVSLKGKAALVKDADVIAAARAAGLVDTKVVGFSETHTALKFVIRVADRK